MTTNTLAGPEAPTIWYSSTDQELHTWWTKTWGPDTPEEWMVILMQIDRLSNWLREAMTESQTRPWFCTAHLSEVDPDWSRNWTVAEAAAWFARVAALAEHGETRLALAVALEDSDQLDLAPFRPEDLRIRHEEPPSLYLFGARYFAFGSEGRQEYRDSHSENPWGLPRGKFFLEFVARRDGQARKYNWEWGNTLWIHLAGQA